MPRYSYIAKSQPHKTIQGDLEAESQQDAVNKLTRMGYFPVSVEIENLSALESRGILGLGKISNKDIVLFTRQLSSLIESGVNILTAFNIISNQITNKSFKAVLNDSIGKIKDGMPLSESLAHYPNLFSGLYTSMIHSGEIGGTLEETLKRLADFMEKEEEFKNSLAAALTYPLFVCVVGVLTVITLLTFVIPRLVTMFEDIGQILPLPTRILIGVSSALRSYWWLILAIIVILVFSLRRFNQKKEGRLFLDRLKLKTKIFWEIILKTEIARLMRTMSLLISSGLPPVYSLDISISVINNQVLKLELEKFKDQISNGSSFSTCLRGSRLFPAFVTNVVAVAEESGTLEKSFMRIAEDYERDVDRSLKALSRLLEPIMILVIGLVVGFIVLSMLLPIFQINLIAR